MVVHLYYFVLSHIGVRIGDKTVFDMEKVYGRLLVICTKRAISLQNLLCYELAPMPPSLYDDYGFPRNGNKAALVTKLAVFCEEPTTIDAEVVDGSMLMYHVIWPRCGTVATLCHNYLKLLVRRHDVYVVFDRYPDPATSTKSYERQRRAGGTSYPNFKLSNETSLPSRDAIMKNSSNKREIINLICSCEHPEYMALLGDHNNEFGHEEADVSIISYVKLLLERGHRNILVLCDDTDVFVLLVYFYWKWQVSDLVLTMKRLSDGKSISIGATSVKLGDKCGQLLALHALSGCDTVSFPYGKGKASALSLLHKHGDLGLEVFGDMSTSDDQIKSTGITFFNLWYGSKTQTSMNELRHALFTSNAKTPKIKSLPPTDEGIIEHLRRAHLQTMVWKFANQKDPPIVDLSKFGWKIETIPVPKYGVTDIAPKDVLKVIACSCSTANACSRNNCSCKAAGLSCTTFCKCGAQDDDAGHSEDGDSSGDES